MASKYPLATSSSSNTSLSLSHGGRPRIFIWKALRRYLWSSTNRVRSFYKRKSGIARALFAIVVCLFAFPSVLRTGNHVRHLIQSQKTENNVGRSREDMHFKRLVHLFMPRQKALPQANISPCSWVYLEVNAYDGRDIDGFFTDANGIFEESLRAEQAVSRAFCAYAFESDSKFADSLLAVRADKGLFVRRFHVFPGVSVGSAEDSKLHAGQDSIISLSKLVKGVTLSLANSGRPEGTDMTVANANGHNGSVVVRVSGSLPELYAHMDALSTSGILCDRVDRLILNVTEDVRDVRVPLPYSPSAHKFHAALGLPGLKALADDLDSSARCRTRLFVLNEEGSLAVPSPLEESAVFYSILAGAPTFNERVTAQADTWMRSVPINRVAVFTNMERIGRETTAARGRPIVVVEPNKPSLEKHLAWMQSWSHLVRVRATWDRYMRDDPDIKWLALVDDDTFVFPAGMREYLTMLDSRVPVWGGSGEQARIDNGDHGEFSHWLRNASVSHGGPHCYLMTEPVPEHLRGSHMEFGRSKVMNGRNTAKKVSHMCHDTFCKRGCPSVPQGAAIVLSRTLVERLRPSIESCEAATSTLCDRCGSQRLYMCVNRFVRESRTLLTRGICRASWKLEHRRNFPIALTFHAFTRNRRLSSMTGSMHGDMAQLWQLGEEYERRGLWQGTVPMPEVADLLGCNGEGHFNHSTGGCDSLYEAAGKDGRF